MPGADGRWPSYVDMCSFDDMDVIRREHAHHLAFFEAKDPDDVELVNLRAAPPWDKMKTQFRLNIKTYKGWRVYMLHTGCIASIPSVEAA